MFYTAGMTNQPKRAKRLVSLDWLRGFVMVLMTIDHASLAYNGGRVMRESAGSYVTGKIYSAAEFLTRWASHLCAPTFVFLAGTALAISTERRMARGSKARDIDMNLIKRGLIIAALDPTLITLLKGKLTFQVLFAIGMGMVFMAFLRRLSPLWLLLLAVGWLVAGEFITALVWDPAIGWPEPLAAIIVGVHYSPDVQIIYPLLPWLAIMILGWVFGQYLNRYLAGEAVFWSPRTLLTVIGLGGIGIYLVVRGINDYGNMFLLRESDSWMHWLFVSKYPPSLSFTALELGIMALFLVGFMTLEKHVTVRPNGPLLVFGQTALFFYILHRILLDGPARLFGLQGAGDLTDVYIISALVLIVLYPVCLWYRGYKQSHPTSWVRYI